MKSKFCQQRSAGFQPVPSGMHNSDTWNPAQYDQFQKERSQPFHDLLAMVQPRQGMRVVDLGCGTGELTLEMHRKLAAKSTLGIDNSDNMLERSRGLQSAGLRFLKSDIAEFEPDEK